jgi:hypothetical protein
MRIIYRAIDILIESASISFGVAAHVLIFALTFPYFVLAVPFGASVRPMGWAVLVTLVACVVFCFGLPMAIHDSLRGKRELAKVGIVLCSSTYFAAMMWFVLAVIVKGFTVLP